jgi:hypothetical protein
MCLKVIDAPELPCRHCGRLGFKRRGLCWRCYGDRRVRRKYPPIRFGAAALDGWPANFPGEAAPTRGELAQPPGSAGRIEELAERAGRGAQLFAGRVSLKPLPPARPARRTSRATS